MISHSRMTLSRRSGFCTNLAATGEAVSLGARLSAPPLAARDCTARRVAAGGWRRLAAAAGVAMVGDGPLLGDDLDRDQLASQPVHPALDLAGGADPKRVLQIEREGAVLDRHPARARPRQRRC